MRAFMRYLFGENIRDKLPHLERDVWTDYDPVGLDPEIYLVLMAGVAPDPQTAQDLMRQYNVTTAGALLVKLPKRRLNLMKKLKALTLKLEGAYATDPHHADYLKYKRMMRHEQD